MTLVRASIVITAPIRLAASLPGVTTAASGIVRNLQLALWNKTLPLHVPIARRRERGAFISRCPASNLQMSFRDLIQDVFRTLWAHRVRTLLPMFGIAWGVVSIVLMVAAGEGLRVGQAKQAETLGRDLMIVFHGRTSLQAGGTRAGRLVHWTDSDLPYLQEEAADCQYAIPELKQQTVRSHTAFNAAAFTVTGSTPEFAEIRSLGVGEGRFYDQDDLKEARRVAFLGSDAKKQLFGSRPSLGQLVYLNDIPFTVIGVMSSKKQDSSYDGWDINKVFIPFSVMRRVSRQASGTPKLSISCWSFRAPSNTTKPAKARSVACSADSMASIQAIGKPVPSGTPSRKRRPSAL